MTKVEEAAESDQGNVRNAIKGLCANRTRETLQVGVRCRGSSLKGRLLYSTCHCVCVLLLNNRTIAYCYRRREQLGLQITNNVSDHWCGPKGRPRLKKKTLAKCTEASLGGRGEPPLSFSRKPSNINHDQTTADEKRQQSSWKGFFPASPIQLWGFFLSESFFRLQ